MRPKLDDKIRLKNQIKVRVTDGEKLEILKRCQEEKFLTLNDYVRSRLFKKRLTKRIIFPNEYKMELHSMDYDLVKIGTNLNQIAKRLNAYNTSMLDDHDLQVFSECRENLQKCFQMLEKYLLYL